MTTQHIKSIGRDDILIPVIIYYSISVYLVPQNVLSKCLGNVVLLRGNYAVKKYLLSGDKIIKV